jgi:hypothetical protein
MYIGYLALGINSCLEVAIFFADTTVIICSKNSKDFFRASTSVLFVMNNWFTVNYLILNLDKTDYKIYNEYIILHSLYSVLIIKKIIQKSSKHKIYFLHINNQPNYKNHSDEIDELTVKWSMLCSSVDIL